MNRLEIVGDCNCSENENPVGNSFEMICTWSLNSLGKYSIWANNETINNIPMLCQNITLLWNFQPQNYSPPEVKVATTMRNCRQILHPPAEGGNSWGRYDQDPEIHEGIAEKEAVSTLKSD